MPGFGTGSRPGGIRSRHDLEFAISDPRFAQIVGRHLDFDLVANTDADEILSHLSGNVSQHLVTVGQRHAEHCAGQNLRHRSSQLNGFFFRHAPVFLTGIEPRVNSPMARPTSAFRTTSDRLSPRTEGSTRCETVGLSMNHKVGRAVPSPPSRGAVRTPRPTSWRGSWSQCIRKNERGLSLHEPQGAAGILPAEASEQSPADETSAAPCWRHRPARSRFRVPMYAKRESGLFMNLGWFEQKTNWTSRECSQ